MKKLLIILIGLVLPYATWAAPATWRSVTVVGTNITMPTIPGTVIASGTPAVGDVLTASSASGTNGVWSGPTWYQYTATDAEGGTLYGTASTNAFASNLVNFAVSYLSAAWGGYTTNFSTVAKIGYGGMDVTATAKNNAGVFSIGDGNGLDQHLTNNNIIFNIGDHAGQEQAFSDSDEIFNYGPNAGKLQTGTFASDVFNHGRNSGYSQLVDGSAVMNYGLLSGSNEQIHNSGGLYNYGDNSGLNQVQYHGNGIYNYGENSGQYQTLTNASDIYEFGKETAVLNGTGLTHIFLAGSGARGTNSNNWVAGDSAYDYFFPGASMRVEGPITTASTLSIGDSISVGATNQWKLGDYATNTVTLITTNYVEVTINGNVVKLAVVR